MKNNRNRDMKKGLAFNVAALCVAMIGMTYSASAAVYIPGVTIESFTSEQSPGRPASDTISDADFNPETGALTTDWITGWMTQGTDYAPSITFDLGANYNLTSVDIWNWNLYLNLVQGAKNVGLSFAGENMVFGSVSSITLAQAPGTTPYYGEQFAVNASDVRYVKLDITSSYLVESFFDRGGLNYNNEVALARVRFEGTAVPEPGTLALAGLGGLLVFLRVRKTRKSGF